METNLIPFMFESYSIRVVMIENEPWWVAADVCAALEINNVSMSLTRLDDDEKGINSIDTRSDNGVEQKRDMAIINEFGLYSLVLSSRKAEAKKFKRWITHEVIPSIRKTGKYDIKKEIEDVDELETLGNMILALSAERKRIRKLEEENNKISQRLDQIETATDHFTVIGYMRYTKGKNIDLPTAAKLGSKLTRYCKQHEVPMGNVPDPRFGMVHTYPKWALDEVLN